MTDKAKTGAGDEAAETGKPQMGKWIGLGIGAGIGSAAIAAALLYAGGTRKKSQKK